METTSQMTDQIGKAAVGNNQREGNVTKKIEQVSAAIPSSAWLLLAGGSIVASLALKMMGRGSTSNFVGQWAPTFLLLGLYNKVVKVLGSDRRNPSMD